MARNRFDVDEKLESFNVGHLRRSFVYIRQHSKVMLISLFFSAIAVICSLLTPKLVGYAVDNTIPNKDLRELFILAGGMVVLIGLNILFSYLRSKKMVVVGQQIVYDIRKDLFAHLQKLPFQYYDDRPHGKILVRIINYVNNVSDMLSNGIINFVLEIFNIIFILGFMFTTNVQLTLVVLAGVPVLVVVLVLLRPKQRRAWRAVNNKSSNLNAYLQESIDGTKITQSFTRQEKNAEIFDQLNTINQKTMMRAVRLSNLVPWFVDNISVIVVALMYLMGIAWTRPVVTFGVLVVMGDYAWKLWQPILNISNLYNNLINTLAYLERIFETMDEPVTVDDLPGAVEMKPIKGHVEFKDVTFSYDGQLNVLEHLNLDVKEGESVALVGPTGAGKTTIVNLISRFYNLTGGEILIDGMDISQVTLHSLRSQMGIMLQDSFIFAGSILDNIRYSKLDATMEEVKRACHTVCADEFIEEMKDGYNTQVQEKGSRLSQGQRQLIAFARTILRDPRILILDEATSSIDVKTEKQLQEGLQNMLKGRTSFIVAHRLSTIRNCDRIFYVSDKGVLESGSHEELMAKKGLYYQLYVSQLEGEDPAEAAG